MMHEYECREKLSQILSTPNTMHASNSDVVDAPERESVHEDSASISSATFEPQQLPSILTKLLNTAHSVSVYVYSNR